MDISLEQKKTTQEEDARELLDMVEKVREDQKGLAQILWRFYEFDRYTEFGFDSFEDFVKYCGLNMDTAMRLTSVWSTVESLVSVGEKWVSKLDWESLYLIHTNQFSLEQPHRIREISGRCFRDAITAFMGGGN